MKILKTAALVSAAIMLIIFAGCGKAEESDIQQPAPSLENITAEEAKEIMDSESGYVILDVRTQEEYDEGHIPGAVLIPDTDIKSKAESVLKDKNQLILVYCRSGRRSKIAAADLVSLGYTNIKEFGGIIEWQYEIEK